MRIALVLPGGVDRSGCVRVIPAQLWLIERLTRRHTVLVVALHQEPQPSRYPLLGAEVANLGLQPGRRRHVRLLPSLLSTLAAFKPDLVHAHFIGETGVEACLAGRRLGVPVLLSIRGGELVWLSDIAYGGQGSRLRRWRIRLALRLANGVTVGSRFAGQALPPWRKDAVWLPLGVDTTRFTAPVTRPVGPPWRLLHIASINQVKDPFMLLEVMSRVCSRAPNVHLDWVGEDTLSGAVQRRAMAEHLGGHIRFHGFQPTDIVAELCRQAHLYVQTSRHEGQGVALLEAAAAGVPTVSTAVGLVPEIAPTGAVAVPLGDATALAESVLGLLDAPQRREALGYVAQQWAQTHDADWTANQVESRYAQLAYTKMHDA